MGNENTVDGVDVRRRPRSAPAVVGVAVVAVVAIVLGAIVVALSRRADDAGSAAAPGTTMWWDDPGRSADVDCTEVTTADLLSVRVRETTLVQGELGPVVRPDPEVTFEATVRLACP